MAFKSALLAFMAAGLLAGCKSLETPFVRGEIPQRPAWSDHAASGRQQVAADAWWSAFQDRQLDRLVAEVLAANNDLAAAALRVHRARLQATLVADNALPTFNAQLSSSHSQPLNGGGRSRTRSSTPSVGVAYELDLWGKLAARSDAAAFEVAATQDDLEAARIGIIATTLETYWRLAHANGSLAIAERSLAHALKTQELVDTQKHFGAVSELEAQEAQREVQAQAAALAELRQRREAIRTQLVVLLNGRPQPMAEPLQLPATAIPSIDPGLPATLLSRRPDLRAAEARLRATLKGVDATRASFYPTFSLTGSLGTSGAGLLSALRNPVVTLGAGVVLPFLNFRNMNLSIQVSQATYQEAVVGFRGTLLRALSDVANALDARVELVERERRLEASLAAVHTVERLTEQRYRLGAVSLKVWLDAQERRRAAELSVATNRLTRLLNASALYRAIGGRTEQPS